MLRAVIFDMDQTLIDWSQRASDWATISEGHLRPICDYLRGMGYVLPDLEWVVGAYQQASERAWDQVQGPEWVCPRQIDILRETLRSLYVDVDGLDMQRVQRLYGWDAIPGVRPFRDAGIVLRTIRAAGVSTGLLTNTAMPMWMRDVELATLGLLEHLDVRLAAGDIGKLKPHVEPFLVVLERLSVVSDEAVFVGDRLYDDVMGAQAAGLRAIWVRREQPHYDNGSVKPNATVDSLTGLLQILDVWFPGWR